MMYHQTICKGVICALLIVMPTLSCAAAKVKWPVTLTIDPTTIDFHGKEPGSLNCRYHGTWFVVGYGKSRDTWVDAKTKQTYVFVKDSWTDYSWPGPKTLYCTVQNSTWIGWFVCKHIQPNMTVDIGARIQSGECVVNDRG